MKSYNIDDNVTDRLCLKSPKIRRCLLLKNHSGKCNILPFKTLEKYHPKIFKKIETFAFQTAGNRQAYSPIKNREKRWNSITLNKEEILDELNLNKTLKRDNRFAIRKSEFASAYDCSIVYWKLVRDLSLIEGIKNFTEEEKIILNTQNMPKGLRCYICTDVFNVNQFMLERANLNNIECDHMKPLSDVEICHNYKWVNFVHRGCNLAKGNQDLTNKEGWLIFYKKCRKITINAKNKILGKY